MRFGKTLIAAAAMLGAALGPAQAASYDQLHRGLGIPANKQLANYSKTDGVKVLVELVPEAKSTMSIFGRTASVVEQLGLEGVEDLIQFKHLPLLSLTATPEILQRLLSSPLVERVSVDDIHTVSMSESNKQIHSNTAWKEGAKGKGKSVAVLDTGVDTRHPFFKNRIVGEACFSSSGSFNGNRVSSACPGGKRKSTAKGAGRDCPSEYECSHGTHVAGTVAGADRRYSGVAPQAGIVAVQVFSKVDGSACGRSRKCVTAYTSDIINALEWVYDERKRLNVAAVNMSLGGGRYNGNCDREAIARAIKLLDNAGVAVVVAAGNESYSNSVASPACVSRAITVGSVDKRDRVSSFSNSSKMLDLWAPGGSIRSAVPGGGTATKSGTSMAAPHVAGALAVLKAAFPNKSMKDLVAAVKTEGPKVKDRRNGLTFTRLDLGAAYTAVKTGKSGGGDDGDDDDDDNGGGLLDVVPGIGGLLGGSK